MWMLERIGLVIRTAPEPDTGAARFDLPGRPATLLYRLDDRPGWTLEVVNEEGTSIVWDDLFDTDREAYDEFRETLKQDGIEAFWDDDGDNVIPFPRGPLP